MFSATRLDRPVPEGSSRRKSVSVGRGDCGWTTKGFNKDYKETLWHGPVPRPSTLRMEADCARIDIVIPRMAAKADEAVEFLLRVNESRRELNEITEDMTVDGLKHELSKCRGMRRDCVVWWLTNFYNDIRTCTRGIASRLNPLAA